MFRKNNNELNELQTKLNDLEKLWKKVKEKYSTQERAKRESVFNYQLQNLVYIRGENQGKKVDKMIIEMLLNWQVEGLKDKKKYNKDQTKQLKKSLIESGIDEKELEELYKKKLEIIEFEEGLREENIEKKIKFIKEILDSQLESGKKIGELESELLEKEKKINELQEQVKRNEEQFRKILLTVKTSENETLSTESIINKEKLGNKESLEEKLVRIVKIIEHSQNERIIKKANNFLETKRTLITIRQETVVKLRNCCDELETYINEKHTKIGEAGSMISAIGTALSFSPVKVGNPVKAAGEIIVTINDSYKRNFFAKCSEEFQEHLVNDKDSFICFNESFTRLISIVHENKELKISSIIIEILKLENELKSERVRLFNTNYEIFDVVVNIWKGKNVITLEEMKKTIESLYSNIKELKIGLEWEENQFNERVKTKFNLREDPREKNNQRFQTRIEQPPK